MGKSYYKYSLTVSAVFKQLKIRKDRKTNKEPEKEVFPDLYAIWRNYWNPNSEEEIAESTYSRIMNAYPQSAKYYELSASFFGLPVDQFFHVEGEDAPEAVTSDSDLLSDRFSEAYNSIRSGLAKWFGGHQKTPNNDALQKLYEKLTDDCDSFQSFDSETIHALTKLKRYLGGVQSLAETDKLDMISCYLVLALTQMYWNLSAKALVCYCEKNNLLGKDQETTLSEKLTMKREEWSRANEKEKEAIRREYLELLESGCKEGAPEAYIERAVRLWEQSDLLGKREREVWGSLDREEKYGLEECKAILEHPEGKRQIVLGTAYWLLHLMMESDKTKVKATKLAASLGIDSSLDALLLACACEKKEALERANSGEWKKRIDTKNRRNAVSLIHVLEKGKLEEGFINYINCDEKSDWANVLTRTIDTKSLPEELISVISEDKAHAKLSTTKKLKLREPSIRFFLISPDEARNLKDALRIMQQIKDNKDADPKKYEIYLRGNEERVSPLVDTAQEHMDGRFVAVHILDPDKRMAQRLLTYHPLFYPIRNVYDRQSRSDGQNHRLHFVIFGDDACCEWLLREGYWLTTFRDQSEEIDINEYVKQVMEERGIDENTLSKETGIKKTSINSFLGEGNALSYGCCQKIEKVLGLPKDALTTVRKKIDTRLICTTITVIAPEAKQFLSRIVQKCPGMEIALASEEGRDEQAPILIEAINLNPDTDELNKWIRTHYSNLHSSWYFVVSSGSDLENLQLAIHLREVMTRERIRMGMPTHMEDIPVIAFRCEDSDIANLSRETVVINENLGKAWYNHYKLIPFGVLSDLYTWEALTDDLLEKISYCTHLQYSKVPIDCPDEGDEQILEKAKNDYLRRSYNRDSSMAVAMSIPYRLFQSALVEKMTSDGESYRCGIMPSSWDILDGGSFFDASFLQKAAELFQAAIDEIEDENDLDENLEPNSISKEFGEIEKWEHERWNRFMISRGWITCSTTQVKKYQEAGNTRKQLYIGKMHPFIVPYSNLKALEQTLGGQILAIDRNNIAATGSIILTEWLDEKMKEQELER